MRGNQDLLARAQQAKAAVSVAMLIGASVPLKRQGRLLSGLCPFPH